MNAKSLHKIKPIGKIPPRMKGKSEKDNPTSKISEVSGI